MGSSCKLIFADSLKVTASNVRYGPNTGYRTLHARFCRAALYGASKYENCHTHVWPRRTWLVIDIRQQSTVTKGIAMIADIRCWEEYNESA